MNSHKYSDLLGVKRNPVEHKTKLHKRSVHTKLVRKSIRIRTTSHKRGDLLDKLSEWIQYTSWLEKKRKRNLALAKKIEQQRLSSHYSNEMQQKREFKDIHTKSKSSRESFDKDSQGIQGTGKVKLKIKVDPSRYKEMPSTSPTYFSPSPRNYYNQSEPLMSQASPLLQSALMASTQNKFNNVPSTSKSSPIYHQKQFSCQDCPKQFSLRSSFVRHARKQHRTDTRSRHFLQYLKNQATNQNKISGNVSFPTKPLPVSKLNLKLKSNKIFETDGYGSAMKRKRKSEDGDLSSPQSKPSKKIKLSLKLGKSKLRESYNEKTPPERNCNDHDDWQRSPAQIVSPTTSPASKVCVTLYRTRGSNNSTIILFSRLSL